MVPLEPWVKWRWAMGKSEYALSDNDRELYRPFSVVRQLSPASATALEFFSPLDSKFTCVTFARHQFPYVSRRPLSDAGDSQSSDGDHAPGSVGEAIYGAAILTGRSVKPSAAPKTCHSSSESWENGDSEYVIRYAGKIRPFLKFQYLYNIWNYFFFLAGFKASSQSANTKYLVRTCSQHAGEQSCCSKY